MKADHFDVTPLRVGVIGVGQMGRNHVRVYGSLPQADLVGLFDENPRRAAAVAAEFNTQCFHDLDGLLSKDLDAVSIAVPTSAHMRTALHCARRGVHVLMEKPLAFRISEAEEIIKACDDNKIKLMVGYIERFNGVVEAVRQSIRGSAIISLDITRVGPRPPRIKDVGVIVDLATHDIDLLRYLTNREILSSFSLASSNLHEHEDHALLLFELEGGISAHINVNWVTPFKVRRIQVAAKDKFVEGDLLNGLASESIGMIGGAEYRETPLLVSPKEPLVSELESFLAYVRDEIEAPVSVYDAFRSLEITCQCLQGGGLVGDTGFAEGFHTRSR